MQFPPVLARAEVLRRLKIVFPPGTPDGDKCIREASAATVAAFLYVGAVEGSDRWASPVHVVRMSDRRLAEATDTARQSYAGEPVELGEPWYRENSREQIRDEVIRQGLVPNGAIVVRPGMTTTSSKPRYALAAGFAALFDPALTEADFPGADFPEAADRWRRAALDPAALARIAVSGAGTAAADAEILVTFPNRESRLLAPGPSSVIAKAVIEDFAPRFLIDPVVIWLSESAVKVSGRDHELVKRLRLDIQPEKVLPDIVLLDRGDGPETLQLVFVEVVASDGPVTADRARAFLKIAAEGRFAPRHVACVTAFLDRARPEAKKAFPSLAWGSFAWFASEPTKLVQMRDAAVDMGGLHLRR